MYSSEIHFSFLFVFTPLQFMLHVEAKWSMDWILISKIYFLNNRPVLIKRVATRISRQSVIGREYTMDNVKTISNVISVPFSFCTRYRTLTSWNKLTSHHCASASKRKHETFLTPWLKDCFACVEHFLELAEIGRLMDCLKIKLNSS